MVLLTIAVSCFSWTYIVDAGDRVTVEHHQLVTVLLLMTLFGLDEIFATRLFPDGAEIVIHFKMTQLDLQERLILLHAPKLAFRQVRQLEVLEHQFLHLELVGHHAAPGSKHTVYNKTTEQQPETIELKSLQEIHGRKFTLLLIFYFSPSPSRCG